MRLDAVNAAQVSKNEPTFSDIGGCTSYFADLTYDATDAVYSDSTGVTTQSTDINSTEGAPLSDANTDKAPLVIVDMPMRICCEDAPWRLIE